MTLPPSLRQPLLIDGYRKSWVGGLLGSNEGAATGAGAAAGATISPGDAAWATGVTMRDTSGIAPAGMASAGIASATGPAAYAGSIPVGRWASVPGIAPGAGTCSSSGIGPFPVPGVINGMVPCGSPVTDCSVTAPEGRAPEGTAPEGRAETRPAGPPFWTNRVTASARAAEPPGVVALPASWEAAASRSCCADDGVAAACWMIGLRLCTASKPGS